MRHPTAWMRWVAALAALAAAATAAAAEGPCADGRAPVGYFGITRLECDCSYTLDTDRGVRQWRFRAEPAVATVAPDGPSAGRLQPGDVIVSVNGRLITTSAGGREFSNATPGETVSLVVRRGGRETPVQVTPGRICLEQLLSLGTTRSPIAPRPPARAGEGTRPRVRVVTPPAPPAPGDAAPGPGPAAPLPPGEPLVWTPKPEVATGGGWFGFGLECQECDVRESGHEHVWSFGRPPTIEYVEPGSPAARAGLEPGDVLTHIDGTPLTSREGSRRFGAVAPGQSVRWTVRRGGTSRTVRAVATARAPARADGLTFDLSDVLERLRAGREDAERQLAREDVARIERELKRELERARREQERARSLVRDRRLRFVGEVGGSAVEVHGLGSVVVDESDGEIVIRTSDAVIRIRPADGTTRVEPRTRGR